MPNLESKKNLHLIEVIEVAISALLLEQPNIQLATEIRKDIEQRVREPPFHKRLFGFICSSPSTTVIFGLWCSLLFIIITIPIVLYFILDTQKLDPLQKTLGINLNIALEVIIAGALGSIVSIMVRIQEFNLLKNVDASILFLTGFFKPGIGASFALFVYAVFKAKLIPLSIELDKELYFFMVLSFISGFSERFAKDIATTTEQKITGL